MGFAKKEYCIIGVGKFSLELANNLNTTNANVVLVDSDHEKVSDLSSKFQFVFELDATDINALEQLDVKQFDKIIVGVSSMELSILIISNLNKLGAKSIIANVKNDIQKEILKIIGPNITTIWPDEYVAQALAFRLTNNLEIDLSVNDGGISIIKIPVTNPELYGIPISKFEIKSDFLTNIIKIIRDGDVIFPVRSTTTLLKDDLITIACSYKSLIKVVNFFTGNK